MRSWQLQGSKDGVTWVCIRDHVGDEKLGDPGTTASWSLECETEYRHLRIQQQGKNASGQTHYLSLSGFDVYGQVTGNAGILHIG